MVKGLTDAGAYINASSAFGTFDQGGNVAEWTEGILGADRIVRGGSFLDRESRDYLAAESRVGRLGEFSPANVGFRVGTIQVVPEPTTGLLLVAGLIGLGLERRRNPRAQPLEVRPKTPP